jgi:hypothetical protein
MVPAPATTTFKGLRRSLSFTKLISLLGVTGIVSRPRQINHSKIMGSPDEWRSVLEFLVGLAENGVKAFVDTFPNLAS